MRIDAHEELAKAILPAPARTPEAELQLNLAIALNPNSFEARILLGNVHLGKRDKEQGVADKLKGAAEAAPKPEGKLG